MFESICHVVGVNGTCNFGLLSMHPWYCLCLSSDHWSILLNILVMHSIFQSRVTFHIKWERNCWNNPKKHKFNSIYLFPAMSKIKRDETTWIVTKPRFITTILSTLLSFLHGNVYRMEYVTEIVHIFTNRGHFIVTKYWIFAAISKIGCNQTNVKLTRKTQNINIYIFCWYLQTSL